MDDYPARVKLIGEYWATLTCKQQNAWHRYIVYHRAYKAYVDALIERECAGIALNQCPDVDRLRLESRYHDAVLTIEHLVTELHGIAESWCKENMDERAG